MDVKNDQEDTDKEEKIKKKLAGSVVDYIWMEQGGHLKYGISFIAALCNQSDKKTFYHESIQIIVGEHWK